MFLAYSRNSYIFLVNLHDFTHLSRHFYTFSFGFHDNSHCVFICRNHPRAETEALKPMSVKLLSV